MSLDESITAATETPPAADGPVRVLLIDDDPSLADIGGEFLRREDDRLSVHVKAAPNEGLAYLESNEVDCVVCDYNMPNMNGLEVLDRVRDAFPDLPFILFTARGSEEIASEAIARGVTDYLQKEVGTEQYQLLANRILHHVERTRTRRALADRESHLKQAQRVADLGSWYKDIRTDDIYWSEEVYDIFEIDSSDASLDHDRFLDFVHPTDGERVHQAWNRALDGEDYDIEHRIVTGAGRTRWVRERATIEFDEDDDPVSALGVVQDVTERKERQWELERQSERLDDVSRTVSRDVRRLVSDVGDRIDRAQNECDSPHLVAASDSLARIEDLIDDLIERSREDE
ncbi:MAG: response regulator [Halanaeroarchaeum sp.]